VNAGQHRLPRTGQATVDLKVCVPVPERLCFEALARRDGVSLSRWMRDAARQRALELGGDPDRGEP
jgi:hypothetical protein